MREEIGLLRANSLQGDEAEQLANDMTKLVECAVNARDSYLEHIKDAS